MSVNHRHPVTHAKCLPAYLPSRKIEECCCLSSSYSTEIKKFEERVQLLKQSNQGTSSNTSIGDKVKFVYGHTEVQPWKLHR